MKASKIECKSKLPTKSELKEMKGKVKSLSNAREDDKMTKEKKDKPKQKKIRMSDEQGVRMIKEWDTKTVSEWAKEFGVSYQTILNMAKVINKKDKSLCLKKKLIPKKREDIADEWIALYKAQEKKK